MKILFVGTGTGRGGTEAHIAEMCAALTDTGQRAAVVLTPESFTHSLLRTQHDVHLFPARFSRSTDPAGTHDLWRAAQVFRPDWIVASQRHEYYSAALVARAAGVKCAAFKHTDLPMRRSTVHVLPRVMHRFIVPSRYLSDHCVRLGMPSRRVHIVPNPIDMQRFRPDRELRAQARMHYGFGADAIVAGFLGRIERAKGLPVLFDAVEAAMSREPRLHALWAGAGDWSEELTRRIALSQFPARHVREGWVSDVARVYAAMDIVSLPSTDRETFGRALAEAQACGLPVLGSRVGGIGEAMLDGITGMMLPPGDVAAWTAGLLALRDERVRTRLGTAGRHFVEREFAAPAVAHRLLAVLGGTAGGESTRH